MVEKKGSLLKRVISFFGVVFFVLAASGVLEPLVNKMAEIPVIPIVILTVVVLGLAGIFTRLLVKGS